jgi:hypothetical protein
MISILPADRQGGRIRGDFVHLELKVSIDDRCARGNFDPIKSQAHSLISTIVHQLQVATCAVHPAIRLFFCIVGTGCDTYFKDCQIRFRSRCIMLGQGACTARGSQDHDQAQDNGQIPPAQTF